jgi:hypothetical protein
MREQMVFKDPEQPYEVYKTDPLQNWQSSKTITEIPLLSCLVANLNPCFSFFLWGGRIRKLPAVYGFHLDEYKTNQMDTHAYGKCGRLFITRGVFWQTIKPAIGICIPPAGNWFCGDLTTFSTFSAELYFTKT